MTGEERFIANDRMRYTKNTASSGLALLAILFDVFFFVSIYKSDVGSFYYRIIIGASIIYNLVFMLAAFLASEGIKNYKIGYAYLLCALGIAQIVRIFILPAQAHAATVTIKEVEVAVMGAKQYTFVIVWLLSSAVCCLASGVIGFIRSRALAAHIASLNKV